jgi:diacylglycerol kinase (ATP)
MSPKTARHLVVAINPQASFGKNQGAGRTVIDQLVAAGHDAVGIQEGSYQDLRTKTRAALRKDSVLVVVGGDGMAHLGVDLATEVGVPLGIIPAGTGNDLARHLGIPLGSIPLAIEHFLRALGQKAQSIDVGISRGPDGTETPYVCVLSAGFDAIVNERANAIKFPKGRHRYTVALLIELWKLKPLSYEVAIDGKDFSGEYLLVAVANSQSFGGGMKVTPEASLVDGLVDVLLLKPLGRLEFLRIYPRVFKGTHVTDRRVIIARGASVRVDARGVIAYADGERMGPLPVEVRVAPLALQVFA